MIKEIEASVLRTMLLEQCRDILKNAGGEVVLDGITMKKEDGGYIISQEGNSLTIVPGCLGLGLPLVIFEDLSSPLRWEINEVHQLERINDFVASIRGSLV